MVGHSSRPHQGSDRLFGSTRCAPSGKNHATSRTSPQRTSAPDCPRQQTRSCAPQRLTRHLLFGKNQLQRFRTPLPRRTSGRCHRTRNRQKSGRTPRILVSHHRSTQRFRARGWTLVRGEKGFRAKHSLCFSRLRQLAPIWSLFQHRRIPLPHGRSLGFFRQHRRDFQSASHRPLAHRHLDTHRRRRFPHRW